MTSKSENSIKPKIHPASIKNKYSNMTKVFIPVISLLFLAFCSPQKELFNQEYISYGNPEYDHLFELLYNNLDSLERIRTDLANLDVSLGIGGFGEEKFLFGLDEYLFNYNNGSYELLLLTQYLKIKYNSTNQLYDKMLKASIILDENNLCALYLLAKIRYENGLHDSSFKIVKYIRNNFDNDLVSIEFEVLKGKNENNDTSHGTINEILGEEVYYSN